MNNILEILREWYDARYGFFLACAGLSVLGLFIFYMEFRQDAANRKRQRQWLDGYVFPVTYIEAVQIRCPHASIDEVRKAYETLRAYFLHCWQNPREGAAMPTGLVDVCWQIMILDTRRYNKFCQCTFGRYLHHETNGLLPDSFSSRNDLAARGRPRDLM